MTENPDTTADTVVVDAVGLLCPLPILRLKKRTQGLPSGSDVLFLAGVILHLDAVLSLVLVPVFVWLLEKRFIVPEENRLRRQFRADFARYTQKTRRWI